MNYDKIVKESNILLCMQCGKCTGSCPTGRKSRIRTRQLILMLKEDIDVLEKEELWFCTTCYTCMERCPKGVNTTDAIVKLRNLAVRKGNYPKRHAIAVKSIYDTGNAFPLSPEVAKIRTMLGLSKPMDLTTDELEREKLKKVLDNLKFVCLVA